MGRPHPRPSKTPLIADSKTAVRWFVARQTMFTSNEQMQKILAASTYSARYVTLSPEPRSLYSRI